MRMNGNGKDRNKKVFGRGRQQGFSILELVIALAITAGLTATVAVTTKNLRERGFLAALYVDARTIKQAAVRFEGDCGFFPPDVGRGVDPGLVTEFGWQNGNHSSTWEEVECDTWRGPYLKEWPESPWGGLYDWDNFPSQYSAWGIPGGGVYLTLKPLDWGGRDGLPPADFERELEAQGIDVSNVSGVISIWVGREPTWNAPSQAD